MATLKVKDGGVAKAVSFVSELDVNELKKVVASLLSQTIGKIEWFGTKEVPEKYMLCDGTELVIADYEVLYGIIGDAFGGASSPDKFKLPDLINRVAWGGTTAGAYKEAGLPEVSGAFLFVALPTLATGLLWLAMTLFILVRHLRLTM